MVFVFYLTNTVTQPCIPNLFFIWNVPLTEYFV